MATISFDPWKTQGGFSNSFNVESDGLTQGDAQDDYAVKSQLCTGHIDKKFTGAMWGGYGILEQIPGITTTSTGSIISAATATQINGFTVFNQAYHGLITASSPVPQFTSPGTVHYYRLGSNARIPLPITAAVAALANEDSPTPVDASDFVWDTTKFIIDVGSSESKGPKVPIKLLKVVAANNNLTVKKNTDGTLVWDTTMPIGLFMI
ncbi:hypothetical protein QE197_10945 [Arsenophonus nasoniae]|uniref:Conserved hypothetical phage protein n=1 Tax=Arsenophonus nasoniae TaxID=638 RepID=D2TYL2_9GAMM|nr:hypothetical protein [Arsenophonus nasoniae]QBY43982.1 hypothetical protein ArsFIN_25550 [Arsenophonus nasoniae]WGM04299.1 hypothetical protein QE258_11670 [Arsenophonus nasoniae]WGM09402.1 hypothetical protein QE197_10945 [Arsenophonus nasoniae]WGM14126.1 hypothetical protein QE193_10840 [Arsenophonus nasoniae]CBA72508.1 conserved hypothetical phage protein [Arsenophonus nasoniae]